MPPPAAAATSDIALARALFVEYAQWLKVDLCFQGFDRELATLPGAYAPPRGRLLLAGAPGEAFGCIALRPLGASTAPRAARRPRRGAGRRRSQAALRAAGASRRRLGAPARRGADRRRARDRLRELKLDTLDWMADARRLYARLGFRECAAYYDNPLPGVVYMALAL